MKILLYFFGLVLLPFMSQSQSLMTVTNNTNDFLVVQARATLNGNVIGFANAFVAGNSNAFIAGPSNDPNAEWEIVRGVDLFTRRKYAFKYLNNGGRDIFSGLSISVSSPTAITFY